MKSQLLSLNLVVESKSLLFLTCGVSLHVCFYSFTFFIYLFIFFSFAVHENYLEYFSSVLSNNFTFTFESNFTWCHFSCSYENNGHVHYKTDNVESNKSMFVSKINLYLIEIKTTWENTFASNWHCLYMSTTINLNITCHIGMGIKYPTLGL